MLTVGNKAVVPDSGASQESSRIGKTKRFTSVCENLQIRKQSKQVNRFLAAKMKHVAACSSMR